MQGTLYRYSACRSRCRSRYSVNVIGVFVKHFYSEMRESASVDFITYVYGEFVVRTEPSAISKSAYRRIIFRSARVYEIRSDNNQTLVISYRAVSRSLQEYSRVFRSAADRVHSVFVYEKTYVGDILPFKPEFERVAYFIFAETFIVVSSAKPYQRSVCNLFGYGGRVQRNLPAFCGTFDCGFEADGLAGVHVFVFAVEIARAVSNGISVFKARQEMRDGLCHFRNQSFAAFRHRI